MGKLYKLTCLLLLLFFNDNQAFSQFFSTGSESYRVKWNYLKTNKYRLIYPAGIDSLANCYINTITSVDSVVSSQIFLSNKKIDILVHPYNVNSNGVVVWAPKRVELITTPQFYRGYSQLWDRQLALHELRHVAQMHKFETGVFKYLSFIFGEQAPGVGVGIYVPKWELEGDAVVSETINSRSGRGRAADFLMFYKAAFLNGDFRNYTKWSIGSLNKYEPDIYSFGYLMLSYVREDSGIKDFTGKSFDYRIRKFYDPFAPGRSYREVTKRYTREQYYKKMVESLTEKWQREDSLKGELSKYEKQADGKTEFFQFRQPLVLEDGRIFAIYSDLDRTAGLVEIDSIDKKITKVLSIGNISGRAATSGNLIVWSEKVPSIRWEQESYSDLFVYDVNSKKKLRITFKERLFNPIFGNSTNQIFAIRYLPVGKSQICRIDLNSKQISSVDFIANGQIKELAYLDNELYATVVDEKGLALYKYSLTTGIKRKIFSNINSSINRIVVAKNELLFESDMNGTCNIYALKLEDYSIKRLTNSRFGAFEPYYYNGFVYYSDFSSNGYSIVKSDRSLFVETESEFPIIESEINQATLYANNDSIIERGEFHPAKELINFHSWAPVYYNIDRIKSSSFENINEVIRPGFILFSQNLLGTSKGSLGYSFNNGFHAGHINFTYRGFYPVIDIKCDFNERDRERVMLVTNGNSLQQITDTLRGKPFMEASTTFSIPLNFSRSGYTSFLVPKLKWKYTNDSFFSYSHDSYNNYQQLTLGLHAYTIHNLAKRAIFPKYGIGTNIGYSFVPFAGENFGSTFYASIYGYLPGVKENNGLRLAISFQHQFVENKRYLQKSDISFPRGYNSYWSKELAYISVDYAFPIYFEDFLPSWLLYIKRLQLIPFFDAGYNKGLRGDSRLISFGSDILVDCHIFGISIPVSAGLRLARNIENENTLQLIFKIPL